MNERTPHAPQEKSEQMEQRHDLTTGEHEVSKNEARAEYQTSKVKDVGEIRTDVEKEAKTTQEILSRANLESSHKEAEHPIVNYELKEIAYQRLLKRTRRHLSPYSASMSKIIHQPVVDAVSEVAGKTIGRPSGIIGGGLVALLGTSIYYYVTRHYGYDYNPFIFLLLMSAGFILGWTIELCYRFAKSFIKK